MEKLQGIKIPAARRPVAVLIGALGAGVLAGLLRGAAATTEATSEAPWVVYGLLALAFVIGVAGALLGLWGLWSVGARLWRLGVSLLATEMLGEPEPEEAEQVYETATELSRTLASLEQDSSQASLLIVDAKMRAGNLAAMIRAIALKADQMRLEAEKLQAALAAIEAGDPLGIARAAGEIPDAHIRDLMLVNVRTGSYWQGVARLVATQLGTLGQWAGGYDRFAENLLGEVSTAKARLAALSASLELTGAARPLVEVRASLDEAQGYLQLERRPGLHKMARELPAINAGLLK